MNWYHRRFRTGDRTNGWGELDPSRPFMVMFPKDRPRIFLTVLAPGGLTSMPSEDKGRGMATFSNIYFIRSTSFWRVSTVFLSTWRSVSRSCRVFMI